MSLVGLKQYGDDYGSSSDDCGPDDAPNSWADDDAPHEEGPVSAINCCAKKFNFHTLRPAFFLIHSLFLYIGAQYLLHIRSNAIQEVYVDYFRRNNASLVTGSPISSMLVHVN